MAIIIMLTVWGPVIIINEPPKYFWGLKQCIHNRKDNSVSVYSTDVQLAGDQLQTYIIAAPFRAWNGLRLKAGIKKSLSRSLTVQHHLHAYYLYDMTFEGRGFDRKVPE